ncbi:MAG: hypothetical protein P4L84_23875 [Isosphaeraceae bacterium]|nr:hypothetical protein [Isosphaeraceae bacterium]
MRRSIRRFAIMATALTLALGTVDRPALAQEEAAGEEKSEGRPWDGYFATGLFAGLALFLVGKSARR